MTATVTGGKTREEHEQGQGREELKLQQGGRKLREHEGRALTPEQEKDLGFSLTNHPRVKAFPVSNAPEDVPAGMQIKTVYFVRHAEALHNEAFKIRGRAAYADPSFFDPELTKLGVSQCLALKPSVEAIQSSIDLVVISPLRRALMTAALAFDHRKEVSWIALETVRERIGKNACDKRRRRGVLEAEYPDVDFEKIGEEDTRWTEHHRETPAEMAERGLEFLAWLRGRPEDRIGVVTHSAFLSTLFAEVFECADPAMSRWFENAELRAVYLIL